MWFSLVYFSGIWGLDPRTKHAGNGLKNKQLLEPTTSQLTVCGSLVWGFPWAESTSRTTTTTKKGTYGFLWLLTTYHPHHHAQTHSSVSLSRGHQSKREKADGPSSLESQCHQKAATTVSARVPSLRWSRCPDVCMQE